MPLPARELRSQRGRLVLSQHADLTVGVDFKLDPDFDGNAQYPTSAYAATRNIRFELRRATRRVILTAARAELLPTRWRVVSARRTGKADKRLRRAARNAISSRIRSPS